MNIRKAFTISPNPARRCNGCGKVVGPDAPVHTGIYISEGPVVGFFHNHQCYNAVLDIYLKEHPEYDA